MKKVIVIGSNELETGVVKVKCMLDGSEEQVNISDLL
jgi:histidyl-tRNA synthetase